MLRREQRDRIETSWHCRHRLTLHVLHPLRYCVHTTAAILQHGNSTLLNQVEGSFLRTPINLCLAGHRRLRQPDRTRKYRMALLHSILLLPSRFSRCDLLLLPGN